MPNALYTSAWSVPLPPDYFPIGISRGAPRGRKAGYRMYRRLQPGPWFSSVDPETYLEKYFAEVLGPLNPKKVLADLEQLAGEKIPVLLCFEPFEDTDAWCHRGMVSAWFWEQLRLEVPEFGDPISRVGWQHPKLPGCARP